MKKYSILFLIFAMFTTICFGCEKKQEEEKPKIPEKMSQKAYDTGCEAVSILEKYLDADIDIKNADERISALYTDFEMTVPDTELAASIAHAQYVIADIHCKWGKYSDVDVRNQIKEIKKILELE